MKGVRVHVALPSGTIEAKGREDDGTAPSVEREDAPIDTAAGDSSPGGNKGSTDASGHVSGHPVPDEAKPRLGRHFKPSESDENYSKVIARLNAKWRLIDCRDSIQWILQRRKGTSQRSWRGNSYCTTRAVLLRCIRERASEVDPAANATITALPERHP